MNTTEKITINANVVDLGQIDLLVEKGVYASRTEFIKTAIKKELDTQDYIVKDIISKNMWAIGISGFSRKDLDELKEKNETIKINVVGMLILHDDVTADLALKTIESISVKGVFRANADLKKALSTIIV